MEEEKFFVNAMDVQLSEMNFEQSTNFVSLKWDNSMDQTTHFESAYSSIASSPSAAAVAGPADSLVIRELIGRLGSIGNNNSANTSCYSTPLNSPPKINLSLMDQQIGGNLPIPANTMAPFHTDPGFAERAAKNSCFGSQNFSGLSLPHISAPEGSKLSRVSSSQSFRTSSQIEQGNAREECSVSDQITNEANVRKRKTAPRGKPRDKDLKVSEHEDSDAKRSKTSESTGTEKEAAAKAKTEQKQSKDNAKPPEPPKDYIHVRARRGQATDSHSLAERVRREKISERMKFLQDLVPGCNKVTGKAVMLDEIINYVQSLQRQVEFLSMKLATVNPRLDFNMEALLLKDMHQAHDSLPQTGYQMDSTVSAFPFIHQAHAGPTIQNGANGSETNGSANPLAASHGRSWSMQLASMDIFGDAAPQLSGIWEDDLQTVVQMGFGQNQDLAFSSQSFHGSLPTARMKVEL